MYMKLTHRGQSARSLTVAATVCGLAVLTGCSSGAASSHASGSGGGAIASQPASSSGGGKTVVVAVAEPFGTGLLGESATDTLNGAKLGVQYVESHGGLPGGANFSVEQVNTGDGNATAVTAFRKLVSSGVHYAMGPAITPQALAVAPVTAGSQLLTFTGSTTTSLRGVDRAKNLSNEFSVGASDLQNANALVHEITKDYKSANQIDVFSYDYQEGRDAWSSLTTKLKAAGMKFTSPNQEFVPLTAPAYTSQISAMLSKTTKADSKNRILALLTYGPGDLTFLKEASSAGLLSRYSAVFTTDEYYREAVAYKGAAPKVWNSYDVSDWQLFKNPVMSWLSSHSQKAGMGCPDDWMAQGFDQILWYAAAMRKAGTVAEPQVHKAFAALNADTAVGKVTFNLPAGIAMSPIGVSETIGSTSAACGVKLIGGETVPTSVTLHGWPGLGSSR